MNKPVPQAAAPNLVHRADSRTPRTNISLEEIASPGSEDFNAGIIEQGDDIYEDQELQLHQDSSQISRKHEESQPSRSRPSCNAPPVGLWELAFETLRKTDSKLVSEYEQLLSKELPSSETLIKVPAGQRRQEQLKQITERGLERMKDNTWHFHIAGEEYTVKEQVAKAAKFALKAKDFIAEAVKASPEASTALAGICLILPVFTNLATVDEANSSGLTYVISRMRFYIGLEELRWPKHGYLQGDLRALLDEALISLYQSIITFQIQSALRLYSNHVKSLLSDMTNWHDWEGMLKTIQTKEDEVRQQFADLDNAVVRDSIEKLSAQAALSYQVIQDQVDIMTKQLKITEEQLDETKTTNRLIENLPDRLNEVLCLRPMEREPLDIKSALQLQFPPNKEFVGREAQIKKLRKMLIESTEYEIAALFGLGGMGKSQVALQFAHEVQRESVDYAVVWISALSIAAFEKDCLEVLKTLEIAHSKDDDVKDIWKRYIISKRDQQWLLIVDNADDLVVLYGSDEKTCGIFHFLPRTLNVRILVTTRFRKIATKLAHRNIVELLQMTPDEANTFLKMAMDIETFSDEEVEPDNDQQPNDEEAREELMASLAYLPLALSQAVSYMIANDMTIGEYLRIFNVAGDGIEWLKKGLEEGEHNKSQDAIATTWIISFEQIQKKEPAATTAILLFLAWIEPKAIPMSLLKTLGSDQEVAAALGTLSGYGFLRKRNKEGMLDMHRLVQLATRLWIEESSERKNLMRHCATHFADIFPAADWENRALWQEYMPHAKKVLEHTPNEHISAVNLSYRVGRCIMAEGRIHDALDLFKYVVARRKETLSEDDDRLLDSQHGLALAYNASGQPKEGIALMEYVVHMRESYAEDNVSRLVSQHELGGMYIFDERPRDGIIILEKVISIQSKTLSKDDSSILLSQQLLATAYRRNGQTKKALALQQHISKIRNDTLVEEDPRRILAQHALALAYADADQMDKAIILWEPLVILARRVFTENSPNVLKMQHTLAKAYCLSQQNEKGVALLKIVVAGQREIFAENHPSLLESQQTLAQYTAEGSKAALTLQKHVVAVKAKTLAANHSSLLASQHILSRLMFFDEDFSGAATLLKQVVALKRETCADDDRDLLTYQGELGAAYIASGDLENGMALLEHVVASFSKAEVDEDYQAFRLARMWLTKMKGIIN